MQTRARTGATIIPSGLLEPGKLYTLAQLDALGVQPKGTRAALTSGGEAISDGTQWNTLEIASGVLEVNGVANSGGDVTTAQLNAALSPKADTATVNAELALKADTAAVTGALAAKADSSAVPPNARSISTTAPLSGGGDLSADRAITIAAQADQTLLGNVSGSSAVPTPVSATQVAQLVASASSTWAARGAGTVLGEIKRITDIGPTGGTRMMWDGTYWRLIAAVDIFWSITPADGILQGAQQIIKQFTIPAGLLRAGRTLAVRHHYYRNGTTDTLSYEMRLGPLGTTADPSITAGAISAISSSNRSASAENWYALNSATVLQLVSSLNRINPFGIINISTTYPQTFTITDCDANALILSFCITMVGTTNIGTLGNVFIELRP